MRSGLLRRLMDYSIVFLDSDTGPCVRCGAETGKGVVGWCTAQDRAVCDPA